MERMASPSWRRIRWIHEKVHITDISFHPHFGRKRMLIYPGGALRLAAEAEFQGSVDFTIYSSPNNQRFAEDYLAVLLYLLAHILFVYGVWIRKSRDM